MQDVETRLIGLAIQEPAYAIPRALAVGLESDDYSNKARAEIWARIVEMWEDETAIDPITVKANLPSLSDYIDNLADLEGQVDAETYAKLIVEQSIRRSQRGLGSRIIQQCKKDDVDQVLYGTQEELDRLSARFTRMNSPLIRNPADALGEKGWSTDTGLPFIDRLLRLTSGGIHFLAGDPGSGKAQPLDAKVLTPSGWKLMGDMQPGDEVVNPSGGTASVTGVYPQGESEIYKVTFSDGAETECCAEHLWHTQTHNQRNRDQHSIKPLKKIIEALKTDNREKWHYVPMPEPVDFDSKELPLDPYLLGYMIGNGCLLGGVRFSTPDVETLKELERVISDEVSIRYIKDYDFSIASDEWRNNPVLDALRELGLHGKHSYGKFIPRKYLNAPLKDRVALLQGLMDSDGSTDGHSQEYSTSSEELAHDFIELVRSLGGKVSLNDRIPHYTYKGKRREGRRSYRVHISLPTNIVPFRLSRKLDNFTPRTKYQPYRYIKSVEPCGKKETQCIKLDSSNQLYITDDYIVTHNTTQIIHMLAHNAQRGINAVGLLAESSQLEVSLGMLTQRKAISSYWASQIRFNPEFRTKERIEKVRNLWDEHFGNLPLQVHSVNGGPPEVVSILNAITEPSLICIDHAYAVVSQGRMSEQIREHQSFNHLFSAVQKAAERNDHIVVMANQYTKAGRQEETRDADAEYGGSGVRNIATSMIHLMQPEATVVTAAGYRQMEGTVPKCRAMLVADKYGNPVDPVQITVENKMPFNYFVNTKYRCVVDNLPTME